MFLATAQTLPEYALSIGDIYMGDTYNESTAMLLFSSFGLASLGVLISDVKESKVSKSTINNKLLAYKSSHRLR
jgi:hypothetical protein